MIVRITLNTAGEVLHTGEVTLEDELCDTLYADGKTFQIAIDVDTQENVSWDMDHGTWFGNRHDPMPRLPGNKDQTLS